jgi:hypothetical protein
LVVSQILAIILAMFIERIFVAFAIAGGTLAVAMMIALVLVA